MWKKPGVLFLSIAVLMMWLPPLGRADLNPGDTSAHPSDTLDGRARYDHVDRCTTPIYLAQGLQRSD